MYQKAIKKFITLLCAVCVCFSLSGCLFGEEEGGGNGGDITPPVVVTKVGKELADGLVKTMNNVNKTAAATLTAQNEPTDKVVKTVMLAATDTALSKEETLFNLVKETGIESDETDFRMRTVNVLSSINEQLSMVVGLARNTVDTMGVSFDFKNEVLTMDGLGEDEMFRVTIEYVGDYYLVQAYQAQGGAESAMNLRIKYNSVTDYEMRMEQIYRDDGNTGIATMYLNPTYAVDAEASVEGNFLALTDETIATSYYNSSIRFDTKEFYRQHSTDDVPAVTYAKQYLETIGLTGKTFEDIKAKLTADSISLNTCSSEAVRVKFVEAYAAWEAIREEIVAGIQPEQEAVQE